MFGSLKKVLDPQMEEIRNAGLFKDERVIQTPQGSKIKVKDKEVINFCANNYLGLANDPRLVQAAKEGLEKFGYGLSSVRFICGTQTIHKQLEESIAHFLEKEDSILYSSCFDANGGLFETLLTKDDVIISDALNHASIIDGVRLCKAERKVFQHADMNDLKKQLEESKDFRMKMIATDGVFSMDGDLAKLPEICELAEEYDAIVMIDDSHSTGFVGEKGRGTAEELKVLDKIDIITSTMGKALGGASGGFTASKKEAVSFLRQRSRPYLFSNSLAPVIVYTSIKALEILRSSDDLRKKLSENTKYFRKKMTDLGFSITPSTHPITPVMLGDAKLAKDMASDLLSEGIYVIGFSYPVVPKDKARIRVQLSAAHTREQLDRAVDAFKKIGKKHKVI
ncbi:glycine C-acetyltransferase [Candidatus Woesearchaeota archaeon]|nr:glycine C-acetyltransferase [Candidatus Woesearchaeota archaeon]